MAKVVFTVAALLTVAVGELRAQCPCFAGRQRFEYSARGPGFRQRLVFSGPVDSRFYPGSFNTCEPVGAYNGRGLVDRRAPEVIVNVIPFSERWNGEQPLYYEPAARGIGYRPGSFGSAGGACPNGMCPLR